MLQPHPQVKQIRPSSVDYEQRRTRLADAPQRCQLPLTRAFSWSLCLDEEREPAMTSVIIQRGASHAILHGLEVVCFPLDQQLVDCFLRFAFGCHRAEPQCPVAARPGCAKLRSPDGELRHCSAAPCGGPSCGVAPYCIGPSTCRAPNAAARRGCVAHCRCARLLPRQPRRRGSTSALRRRSAAPCGLHRRRVARLAAPCAGVRDHGRGTKLAPPRLQLCSLDQSKHHIFLWSRIIFPMVITHTVLPAHSAMPAVHENH
jgi:hypothetical protein